MEGILAPAAPSPGVVPVQVTCHSSNSWKREPADEEREAHRHNLTDGLRIGVRAYLILNLSFLNMPVSLFFLRTKIY